MHWSTAYSALPLSHQFFLTACPLCGQPRRLSGATDELLAIIRRGGEREKQLACEALVLLWIDCGQGEDSQFVRVQEELTPFILTSSSLKDAEVNAAQVRYLSLTRMRMRLPRSTTRPL